MMDSSNSSHVSAASTAATTPVALSSARARDFGVGAEKLRPDGGDAFHMGKRRRSASGGEDHSSSGLTSRNGVELFHTGETHPAGCLHHEGGWKGGKERRMNDLQAGNPHHVQYGGLYRLYRSDGRRLVLSGLRDSRQVSQLAAFLHAVTEPVYARSSGSPVLSSHYAARQASIFHTEDTRTTSSVTGAHKPRLRSRTSSASSSSLSSPALVTRRPEASQEDSVGTEKPTSVSGLPLAGAKTREDDSSGESASQVAREKMEEEGWGKEDVKQDLDGRDYRYGAIDRAGASVYLDDASVEVVVAVLDQLRGFQRLEALQLHLWGVDWTPHMLQLLEEVFAASASTLRSVALRCRVSASVLHAMLKLIPRAVRHLDISENMLGHCDSGTLVVPELERLLRENGLQSLKANQVGWNRDEAKKLLAEAINRLGVFNCLQWLEERSSLFLRFPTAGLDLSEYLDIPPQIFMMASVPGPPSSSSTIATSPLFHLYTSRLPSSSRGSENTMTKSLLPTAINYTLLRFLRIRAFLPLLTGCRVRVWWKPTSETQRTDFSGRYWPARIIHGCPKTLVCKVIYDNNEEDFVPLKFLQPQHPFRYGGGWGHTVPSPTPSTLSSSSSSPFLDLPSPLSCAMLPSFLSSSLASSCPSSELTTPKRPASIPRRGTGVTMAEREGGATPKLPCSNSHGGLERTKDEECGELKVKVHFMARNRRTSKKTEGEEELSGGTPAVSHETVECPSSDGVPLLFFSDDEDRKGEPQNGATEVSGSSSPRNKDGTTRRRSRRRPTRQAVQGNSCREMQEEKSISPRRRMTVRARKSKDENCAKPPHRNEGPVKNSHSPLGIRRPSSNEAMSPPAPSRVRLSRGHKGTKDVMESEGEAGSSTSPSSRISQHQSGAAFSSEKKKVDEEELGQSKSTRRQSQGKQVGQSFSCRTSHTPKETEDSISHDTREEKTATRRRENSASLSACRPVTRQVQKAKNEEERRRRGRGRKGVSDSSHLPSQTSMPATEGVSTDATNQIDKRRGRRRSPLRTSFRRPSSRRRPHSFTENLQQRKEESEDGNEPPRPRERDTPPGTSDQQMTLGQATVGKGRSVPQKRPEPGNQQGTTSRQRKGEGPSLHIRLPQHPHNGLSTLPRMSSVARPEPIAMKGERRVTRSMMVQHGKVKCSFSKGQETEREMPAAEGDGLRGDVDVPRNLVEAQEEEAKDAVAGTASETQSNHQPLCEVPPTREGHETSRKAVAFADSRDSEENTKEESEGHVSLRQKDICCAPAPIRNEDLSQAATLYPHLFEQYLCTNRLRQSGDGEMREERRRSWRREGDEETEGCNSTLPKSISEQNVPFSRGRQRGGHDDESEESRERHKATIHTGNCGSAESAEEEEDNQVAYPKSSFRSKRGYLPDQEHYRTCGGKRRLKEEGEQELRRTEQAVDGEKTSQSSQAGRHVSREKILSRLDDHKADAEVDQGGGDKDDAKRTPTRKKNVLERKPAKGGHTPASSNFGDKDSYDASCIVPCWGGRTEQEEMVASTAMPLDVIGNVLLPGEFCEFRDEEEHRGSDPSDFVGMVVGINPQEPLYVVRYVYHDDDTLLQVNSGDVRRAVVVPLDAWMAWRFEFQRFMFRQQELQQLRGCTEKSGQSEIACERAGMARGYNVEKAESGRKQSFPSFRKSQKGSSEVPPFATFYMLPLATMARLKHLASRGKQETGFQRNPVDSRLLPPDSGVLVPATSCLIATVHIRMFLLPCVCSLMKRDFYVEFSARQAAYIAERCHVLEVSLDKEYPAFRSALDGGSVLSERINNSLTLPGSAEREPEFKKTERGEHKILSSYQLSLWKADALVHPRMQDRDASAWLGLLPKEHLLSKVIQLNKDIAHLKSQLQREAGLSDECQRLRVALEAEKGKKEEVEGLLRCIICVARPRNVLVEPCLHFYVCSRCSQGLSQCPICRSKITSRIEVKREEGGQTSDEETP
ncbi:hypothetical protein CSUI_001500 [Cystoisospora suis]|uniref:RING-type domain-containing protein n=1 Tax=Cystoisospora suis TaxID=483139 RepID=A0A2C6L8C6_9APIC|nr:hypothetical protein CSUI_001500 [Cystoisospora suis]